MLFLGSWKMDLNCNNIEPYSISASYLIQNASSKLSKIIFAIRSGTFVIKVCHEWKYDDNACIACKLEVENMDNFKSCISYENCTASRDWKMIFENNPIKQFKIAKIAQ